MNNYDYKKLAPFKWFVLNNFPYIDEDFDAITNWQLFCKLGKEINKIIDSQNNVGQAVEDYTLKFIALYNYVHDYFDNLDVQNEINNKLDTMLEDGTLEQIIEQFIQSSTLWCFDTVANMTSATNLIDGSYAKTLGFYDINDGGCATYKIRTLTQEDVVDGASIISINETLVAELIPFGALYFKQFGAKNNGTDLNDTYIVKALNYLKNHNVKTLYFNEGNYLFSQKIYLPSGKYVGVGNVSLIETNSNDEVFITNEHFLDYSDQDEIEIENITIEKTSVTGGSLNGKRCFRFACTNNLHLNNIIMKSSVDSQFGVIDLYSWNTNALIENCKAYKTNTATASSLVGGYAIREYSASHTTKNVTLRNCLIDKDGIDESLWISGWFGNLENVLVDNMQLYDRTDREGVTTIFVDRCKNVTIQNSYFYKQGSGYRFLQIATSENFNQVLCDNIKIFNNTFEIGSRSNTSDYATFIASDDLIADNGVKIFNNNFIFNDTDYPTGCFYRFTKQKTIISNNNNFYGNCKFLAFDCKHSVNDTLYGNVSTAIFDRPIYIDNFKNYGTCPYLYRLLSNTDINEITVRNTLYNGNRVFTNNNSSIPVTHNFYNNIFNYETAFSSYYGGSSELKQTFNIINCAITKFPITTTLFENLNISNLTVNNTQFKGIPQNQNDRGNCPVGTVFFSNTQNKSIVRKIEEGYLLANWEEL